MNRLLRIHICISSIFIFFLSVASIQGQNPTMSATEIAKVNIDDLSDEQIAAYWQKAQNEGYTINDIEIIGAAQGLSQAQIVKLKQRIQALSLGTSQDADSFDPSARRTFEPPSTNGFGLNPLLENASKKSEIFGYDFFNNPNISFEPSLNLSAPGNYQLGPGDEMNINVYGAAENNYAVTISPSGTITVPNIGPIYLTGLTLDEARLKINGSLRQIYNGIGASENSPYKVYTDVSLSNIRRVQVNIIGEVEVPGSYSLSALSTVLNALYASGGPSENGTFRDILVVRDGQVVATFDVYQFLVNGNTTGNLYLEDQDALIVRPYKERVTVEGEAKRPGIYELKREETFNDLRDYFGGFTSEAYKDRVVVQRVNGEQREVKEIDLDGTPIALQDGDKVVIGAVVDRYENRVIIEGAVYRPGMYALESTPMLSDIFAKALGVKEDAFVNRAILYRQIEGYKTRAEAFSVSAVLSNERDMALQREDSIYVFSKEELDDIQKLTISGAVNDPQNIPFVENLTVKDLIVLAGGFEYGADPNNIVVSRLIVDEDVSTLSEQIDYTATKELEVVNASEFVLQPNDQVSVFYLRGFEPLKTVTISGEVSYPGEYSITSKNQRVSDLLKKAGGLSPYAYAKGATLVRNLNLNTDSEQQKELLFDLAKKDSILEVEEDEDAKENSFRIGLNLVAILENSDKNTKYDLILEEGDELIIPSVKQTVEVRGEVLAPSLIRYDRSKSLRDYVNGSGGFATDAKKGKAYVLYPNGEVRATKNFLFFRSYPKVEPGSVILVPPKPIKSGGITVQEIIGITTGLGTIGLIIDRLSSPN